MGALKQRGAEAVRALRIAKWVLFLAGCALALSPVAVVIAASRAEARLKEVVQEIVRRGEPAEASQLARPPIPDSENAALVYGKAFAAIELSDEDEELIADLRAERVSLGIPAIAARARAILDQNTEALELIHCAAGMPRCDFRVDWSRGFDVEFPHHARLRTCARLLEFESLMLLDAGRVDEAADACGTIFRVANAADEPCTLGLLNRYGIDRIGSEALTTVLRESQPDSGLCRSLAEEIALTDLVASFEEALKGERACTRTFFAVLGSTRDPWDVLDRAPEEMGPRPASEQHRPARGGRPRHLTRWWLACDELAYLGRMEVGIRESSHPYREAVARVEGLDRVPMTYVPPVAVVTSMLIPAFDTALASRDAAIARRRMAQVALLLKAYRGERGQYPESLAELGEFAGRELPADPFSGTSLVYQREAGGFVIYNWGANLKDDGGSPPPPGQSKEGDMLFRCLR